jgi:hypothetical protein
LRLSCVKGPTSRSDMIGICIGSRKEFEIGWRTRRTVTVELKTERDRGVRQMHRPWTVWKLARGS